MSNNYGNNNQDDSIDERELDEQKNQNLNLNQEGMSDKEINLNPSISKSIVYDQENTGVGQNVNEVGQNNNPSSNFSGPNGNGLSNKDNNNDNSQYQPQQFIGQPSQQNPNQNNQMNNFFNDNNNSNNQVPFNNSNNNNQNINNNNNNQNLNKDGNYPHLDNNNNNNLNNNNNNLNNNNNNLNNNNNNLNNNNNNNFYSDSNNLNNNNNNNFYSDSNNLNNNNNNFNNNNNLNINNNNNFNNNNSNNFNNNNNNNNFNNNNNKNNFNNNNNNNNFNNNNNYNNFNSNNNNNFNNNNNNNFNNINNNNYNINKNFNNNNIAYGNNMQSFDNQNYGQGQVINQNNISNNFPNNNIQINSNNQNNNNMKQMSSQTQCPFSNIRNPITTVLTKLGETEYLNSILYLIGNIKVFCEYFYIPNQENKFVTNIDKAPLSFIIHRLFRHFYPSSENENSASYKPEAIKRYLSEINRVYKSEKKRNPNELFSFILDSLHNELKKQPKGESKNPNNIFNIKDVIQTGIRNFQYCDISKISEHFNWFEIKDIKCTQCNKTMYSFHSYHMLELDILNTFKKYNNNFNSNNSITIYDCLSYYQSRRKNLKAYCMSCNKNTIVESGLHIYCNPNIFVFSLNRGLINGNFDSNLTSINFQLNDQIDLNNFVDNKQISKRYELKGIVSISLQLNNYVAFCKSPVNNNWYYYDSEKICPADINYILSEHDSTKNTGYIPCILVYQLVK